MAHDFGQCFRAILNEKNLTQVQAAELLSWAQSSVARLCARKALPRQPQLEHISNTLHVPIHRLVGKAAGQIEAEMQAEINRRLGIVNGKVDPIKSELAWMVIAQQRLDGAVQAFRLKVPVLKRNIDAVESVAEMLRAKIFSLKLRDREAQLPVATDAPVDYVDPAKNGKQS